MAVKWAVMKFPINTAENDMTQMNMIWLRHQKSPSHVQMDKIIEPLCVSHAVYLIRNAIWSIILGVFIDTLTVLMCQISGHYAKQRFVNPTEQKLKCHRWCVWWKTLLVFFEEKFNNFSEEKNGETKTFFSVVQTLDAVRSEHLICAIIAWAEDHLFGEMVGPS